MAIQSAFTLTANEIYKTLANMIISQNHHFLKIGFLFFAPQFGQVFAFEAMSLPQDLHLIIFALIFVPPKFLYWWLPQKFQNIFDSYSSYEYYIQT